MGRKENKTTPIITSGWLYHDEGEAIAIDSPTWRTWLETHGTFYHQTNIDSFTARKETRGGKTYWYGFRKVNGKLYKTYLGSSPTGQQLAEAGEALTEKAAGRTAAPRTPSPKTFHEVTIVLDQQSYDALQQLTAQLTTQHNLEFTPATAAAGEVLWALHERKLI